MNALGRHILVELIGCSPEVLNDVSLIEAGMLEAAAGAGATVINSTFHHFSPTGVSGVVVIQESHLAIHTWPEYGYAAVDLFTCGSTVDPWLAFDQLKTAFRARSHTALEMWRGSLSMLERAGAGPDEAPARAETDEAPARAETEEAPARAETEEAPARAGSREPQARAGIEDARRRAGQALLPRIERNLWFTDRDQNLALSLRYTGDPLFRERSPWQTVRVFETPAYGRMLAIGDTVVCTERDEFHYHEMLVHPALLAHGRPERVLIIGGGDGGAAREVLKHPSIREVVLVEIDETVVRASALLPGLASAFEDPRLELRIEDGIRYVASAPPGSFDIIVVDGADPVGPSKGLYSSDFYRHCREALRLDGLVTAQGLSPMFLERAFVDLNRCLKQTFGPERVDTLLFYAPTYPSGMWSIQFASRDDRSPARDVPPERIRAFAQARDLRYYNADIHVAAFALPTFVRRMLEEDADPC